MIGTDCRCSRLIASAFCSPLIAADRLLIAADHC